MDELDFGWQIIEGEKPILVVAGHNFAQGRYGKIKSADLGTGAVARDMCKKYIFWGIISTKEQMDPNWYVNSPFREKVKEIIKQKQIKLILDIHGSNLGRDDLVKLIGNKKFKENYKIEADSFKDDQQTTLAEELNNEAAVLQIEIREDGRVRTIDEVKYDETQNIIKDLLDKLI